MFFEGGSGLRLLCIRIRQYMLRGTRTALLFALVLPLVSGEAFATGGQYSSWSPNSFSPGALGGQAGAQAQNANNNSLASNLGKAAAVLSMAAGGLYMAKGATQLKCCSSGGCTGAGVGSQKTKQNIKTNTQQNLDKSGISGGESWNECTPRPRLPFALLELFRPAQADAALGPCLDALIALTTGGLMLLQGIMALQAANQSGQLANSSYGNAGNMAGYPGAGTSPTPDNNGNGSGGPGNSSLGNSSLGPNANNNGPIKLDPALLRTGKANDIMAQFEKQFGIPRDQFANKVLNGQDPRQVLGSAPSNALSNADMNQATSRAQAMSDADKAKALDGTDLGTAQRELASKLDDKFAVNPGAGPAGGSAFKGSSKKADEAEDLAGALANASATSTSTDASLAVSPEVKAALAAKELDDRRNGITDLTIFEVVHQKYREKSKMIFGFDPDNLPGGVTR